MENIKRVARWTGLGYLIIFATGFFANFFVLEGLVVPGDGALTLQNITDNLGQYRWGLVAFLIMVIIDVVLAMPLYRLTESTNRHLAKLSSWLRIVNGTLFGLALVDLFEVLKMVGKPDLLEMMTGKELQLRILLLVDSFNFTWLIGLVFFGIHLLLLGYLVFRSDSFPRFIGVFLQLAGVAYLLDSFCQLLLPQYLDIQFILELSVVGFGILGELSLTLWLLLKGVINHSIKTS
jgi:hypothetical protein